MAADAYREIAEFYDHEYPTQQFLREDVPMMLGEVDGEPGRFLELGCGTGRAALPIAEAGHTVVGLDVDEIGRAHV